MVGVKFRGDVSRAPWIIIFAAHAVAFANGDSRKLVRVVSHVLWTIWSVVASSVNRGIGNVGHAA
jgi:hypothetical protein